MPTVGVDLAALMQFGFAALAAGALWQLIRELIPKLTELTEKLMAVVQQNAVAIEKMAQVTTTVCQLQDRNVAVMHDVAERISRLEAKHELIRECPLLTSSAKEGK